MVESTSEIEKQVSKKVSPFMMNIQDSNHVKPLLERLIASEASWRQTISKDYRLKWVSPVIQDEDLITLLQ
jgi:hypothetical protein